MRRENGTGTITKLSGKRRRPYIAKFMIGKNSDGNRRYVIVGYFATKSEASAALARFSFNPDPMSVSNLTFAQGFKMIEENIFKTKSESSVRNYLYAFKKCEPLHNKSLRSLKTLHYQAIIDNCECQSRSYRNTIKMIMSKVCDYAVQNDIISRNYAKYVVVNGTVKEKQKTFTDSEINILFSDNSQEAQQLLMLIYSGLRISEFSNLRKADIHIQDRYIICGIKTEAGKHRIVPIHSKTLSFWEEFYEKADDYLFLSESGNPMFSASWRYKFKKLLKRLNIPFRSPHATRHTCASLMARDGVNPVYIKEILGHTDYAFTVNRYTHADPNLLVNEINKMN
jgi:integrase